MSATPVPIILLVIISTAIGVSILVGAAFLFGLNGQFMKAIAKMLACVAIEIAIAIAADFFIGRPAWFACLKIAGRIIEGIGVFLFLRNLIDLKRSPITAPSNAGDYPPEFWQTDYRQAFVDMMKPEFLK